MPLDAFDACRDVFRVAADTGVCHIYMLAKDWQSLIAGSFALVAAAVTLTAVNRQNIFNIKAENRSLARESVAAKAVLPLSLSAIVAHGNECIRSLNGMRSSDDPVVRRRGAGFLPKGLMLSVDPIQRAIRFGVQPYTGQLAALASWLQVHEARLEGLRIFEWEAANLAVSNDAIELMMADSAQLIARAEDLFEYGRSASIGAASFDVGKAQWALARNGVPRGVIAGDGDPHARVVRQAAMDNQTTDRVGVRRL